MPQRRRANLPFGSLPFLASFFLLLLLPSIAISLRLLGIALRLEWKEMAMEVFVTRSEVNISSRNLPFIWITRNIGFPLRLLRWLQLSSTTYFKLARSRLPLFVCGLFQQRNWPLPRDDPSEHHKKRRFQDQFTHSSYYLPQGPRRCLQAWTFSRDEQVSEVREWSRTWRKHYLHNTIVLSYSNEVTTIKRNSTIVTVALEEEKDIDVRIRQDLYLYKIESLNFVTLFLRFSTVLGPKS